MPELLLELLSEEIPARMQRRGAADLERAVAAALEEARLDRSRARSFASPRRLTLLVEGLPEIQPDLAVERKGPRADAPQRAIDGFLKSVGFDRDRLEERDDARGKVLYAVGVRKGRPTAEVLAEILPRALAAVGWPKSMRWGGHEMRWVRPLHSILCVFDGAAVPFRFGHLTAANLTAGHRFHRPHRIIVNGAGDYRLYLEAARVMFDHRERERVIAARAVELAAAEGLTWVEDEALLREVAGLVEWPVVHVATIDAAFMALPAEVLAAAMRGHQKYMALRTAEGALAPRFVFVANLEAADGGAAIVAGNERVLRARLADARFFWDQDRAVPLRARVPDLGQVVFHADIGSLADKVYRMETMIPALIAHVDGAEQADVASAVRLCKADLLSAMVGEFPELQGIMGRHYALADGEKPAVADAVAEHHAPRGPADACPAAPVSVAVALLDKVDTLASMFAVGLRPTGSKDPFALRRAGLGIIRLILENGLRVPLRRLFLAVPPPAARPDAAVDDDLAQALLDFLADRLKVHLRERGVRHDLIAAVFARTGEDDLVRLIARVEALQGFLASDDGGHLLTAYRRAANILAIEQQKDGAVYAGEEVDAALFAQDEERRLYDELTAVAARVAARLAADDHRAAFAAFAGLRPSVDSFFDEVTVNAPDPALRANRLRLMDRVRLPFHAVADFSLVEG